MSKLDVQHILSSRYRTSQEADQFTDQLRQNLGLDTRAQVARLSIGRSLSLGKLSNLNTDSHGRDIPAMSLFAPENIGAWVGLIITHALKSGDEPIDTMEDLRNAVRLHWHRGALALREDWKACHENYDKFVETLVTRRSDMPEFSASSASASATELHQDDTTSSPLDASQPLTKALNELGIKVQVKDVIHGPRITRYRVLLMNLADSTKLKRNMSQLGLALNLGESLPTISNGDEAKTVFIDLPRAKQSWKTVSVNLLRDWAYTTPKNPNQLLVYAGVNVVGEGVVFDLGSVPHLLVGGTTNSGKSVCLHSLILSLLIRNRPENLQLALIDPKQVEFASYSKLPNLYRGAIALEAPQAREMLQELAVEMDVRYSLFNRLGVVNIVEARKKGQALPFIVLFIEEMADLVMVDPEVESLIARLAQKARAAGIHLVLATQRPDSETFSGLIRSNIPGRIALTVQKGSESTIIIDERGAENLLMAGDMLIRLPGSSLMRAHGPFVHQNDISKILENLTQ